MNTLPVVPVELVAAVDPVAPLAPVDSVVDVVPVDFDLPVEPVTAVESVAPLEPVEPIAPSAPLDSVVDVVPVDFALPVEPVMAVETVAPVAFAVLGEPPVVPAALPDVAKPEPPLPELVLEVGVPTVEEPRLPLPLDLPPPEDAPAFPEVCPLPLLRAVELAEVARPDDPDPVEPAPREEEEPPRVTGLPELAVVLADPVPVEPEGVEAAPLDCPPVAEAVPEVLTEGTCEVDPPVLGPPGLPVDLVCVEGPEALKAPKVVAADEEPPTGGTGSRRKHPMALRTATAPTGQRQVGFMGGTLRQEQQRPDDARTPLARQPRSSGGTARGRPHTGSHNGGAIAVARRCPKAPRHTRGPCVLPDARLCSLARQN